MEQKLKQRICIEFCVKLQISATETFEMLNKAFPNDAPKRTTVFEWHSRFKAGRISVEDDPRQGRPKFQRTNENVQKITDLIKENPRTTLLELEQDTGISKTTIGRIVTEDLKLKKIPAKFIPRFLTNEQKLCRLATCEDMMEMTRTDPEWKDKIITGDETWVYGYDPETKPQSAEWREQMENTNNQDNSVQEKPVPEELNPKQNDPVPKEDVTTSVNENKANEADEPQIDIKKSNNKRWYKNGKNKLNKSNDVNGENTETNKSSDNKVSSEGTETNKPSDSKVSEENIDGNKPNANIPASQASTSKDNMEKQSKEDKEIGEDAETNKKNDNKINGEDTETHKKNDNKINGEDTETHKKNDNKINGEDTETHKKNDNKFNGEDTETHKKNDNKINGEDTETNNSNMPTSHATTSRPTNNKVIIDLRSIYVGNIPYTATMGQLIMLFKDCGLITDLKIVIGPNQRPKGYAFIQFEYPHEATLAINTMNGKEFEKRIIVVRPKMLTRQPRYRPFRNVRVSNPGIPFPGIPEPNNDPEIPGFRSKNPGITENASDIFETIKIKVCRYADTFREKVVRELQMEKEKRQLFSLTLDEWTSIRSKRYLNINIHSRTKVWNLGLTRISGVFSSEQCKYVICAKLLEFGIDFETDIVCVTTDGCAMMVKLGHIIGPLQQLCYAHGLHLAVMDVLYDKKKERVVPEFVSATVNEAESDLSEDNNEDTSPFNVSLKRHKRECLILYGKNNRTLDFKHLRSNLVEVAHTPQDDQKSTEILYTGCTSVVMKSNREFENRAAIIVVLRAGRSPKEIVDFLKLPKTTIYRVKKQFDEADSNKEGIATRKKHSRRTDRVRGEEFVKNVKEKIDGNPGKSMRAIAKEMEVGSMTIVRTIHEDLGLKSYALRKGQLLTENMKNNRKGKAAALLNNLKHDSFGMLRFFSDEKNFDVDQKVNPRNDRWICKDPSEIPVVMVFLPP
ncbi:hypothetical protein LAZ67_2000748 [Cordylochernes scorpioides]|uniref:RRM domain-containing protein n=1 Tax=Cordylochernes scorpioides TaxID=51811 RepID=A0ABY6K206_9ARAC|nr:hypothetical protein LAZ67_2000748 [Cordylochernes scorpioides]